ncbi:MAG: PIN domain-containing protein [Thiobacillus sp.]|nr:PIN domain-containing protein [Thiobacillus sp.]
MNRVLDSVILIDHFNGVPAATDFLARWASECAISAITRAEVLTGFEEADWAAPMMLLAHFPVLPVDAAVADEAARLRRQYRWKLPDALQAAFAITRGLRLVTRNTRDFPPARFGFVEVPYLL